MHDDENEATVHVDCRRLTGLIGDYVDDALGDDVREAVDGHVGQCAPCLAFLNQYRFASEATRQVLLHQVPRDLETRLLAFLRSRCQPAGGRPTASDTSGEKREKPGARGDPPDEA